MERYLGPGFNDIGANSVDQDQSSLIRVYMTVSQRNILIMVYTVCKSVWILWKHYCNMVKSHCSNFRIITAIFWCPNFRNFMGNVLHQSVLLLDHSANFCRPWQQQSWYRYEPRHEKTCLQGLRRGQTQTGLRSHRDWLEAWNFGCSKRRYCTI